MGLGTLGTGFGRLSLLSGRGGEFDLVRDVFGGGDSFYRDFTSATGLYQTDDTSTPVTADGQTIGRAEDQSPNNRDLTQASSGPRPVWKTTHALFDGNDDRLETGLKVEPSGMTLIATFRVADTAATKTIIGMRNGTGPRYCALVISSGERLAGRWGSQIESTINYTDSNLSGIDAVALMRANTTGVELWLNGTRVYTGAAADAATIPNTEGLWVGATNNEGAAAVPFSGRIHRAGARKFYIPDDLILPAMSAFGTGFVSI
ncbi:MAG: hypothetical protein AB7F22_10595 [Reyranella sp.]|uniref:hypothetical protein n=1 Tax=Reyranella sp. TaxID=1929291 RepID=UPI003D118523